MRERSPELKWGASGQKCMDQLSTEGTAPLEYTPGVGGARVPGLSPVPCKRWGMREDFHELPAYHKPSVMRLMVTKSINNIPEVL